MSDGIWYGAMNVESDHDLTLVVPGNLEMLRQCLPAALAQLGYKVLSDQPLLAKRAAVGGARYACSFEPLDYQTKLLVGLRALNQNATSVTFSYEVKSYGWGLYEGDKDTLQREAEALVALALAGGVVAGCGACGTEVTDDSRFCRRCGAPLAAAASELEVYRLTRGTRAGMRDVVVGAVFMLVPALVLLALAMMQPRLGSKAAAFLLVLLGLVATFGLWALVEGIWELYRTANPKETKERQLNKVAIWRARQLALHSLFTTSRRSF